MNCISTEFTEKKHGGEKGVPFRILLETFNYDDTKKVPTNRIHAASCQVKVFKPKGADRKHKTDREKMNKRPEGEREKYQPAYDCTILKDCPLDNIYPQMTRQSNSNNNNNNNNCSGLIALPSSHQSPDRKPIPLAYPRLPRPSDDNEEANDGSFQSFLSGASYFMGSHLLTPEANADDAYQWLQKNRFEHLAHNFNGFSGRDLLTLSRNDIIQICGVSDGIRLYNALHSRPIRPKLTLYVRHGSEQFRAIFLENLTFDDMRVKFSRFIAMNSEEGLIRRIYYNGPSNVKVIVDDEFVRNLNDESTFTIEIQKGEYLHTSLVVRLDSNDGVLFSIQIRIMITRLH